MNQFRPINHHYRPSVIGTLYTTLINLNMGLREIGNNPALPEMVRQQFGNMASNVDMMLNSTGHMINEQVHNGQGPVCQGIYATAQVLGLEKERQAQLNELMVPKDWRFNKDITWTAKERQLQDHYVSKLFETQHYAELFTPDEDGKLVRKIELTESGYTIHVTLKAVPVKDDDQRVWLTSIGQRTDSKQQYWWFGNGIESSVMYQDRVQSSITRMHGFHTLEIASFEFDMPHADQFWDVILQAVGTELGFTFVDYDTGDGYLQKIVDKAFFMNVDIMDKADQKITMDAVWKALGTTYPDTSGRDAKGLSLKTSFGSFALAINDTSWYSYSTAMEKRVASHWERDKPLIALNEVIVGGQNRKGQGHALPYQYGDEIRTVLLAWLFQLIEGLTFPAKEEPEA